MDDLDRLLLVGDSSSAVPAAQSSKNAAASRAGRQQPASASSGTRERGNRQEHHHKSKPKKKQTEQKNNQTEMTTKKDNAEQQAPNNNNNEEGHPKKSSKKTHRRGARGRRHHHHEKTAQQSQSEDNADRKEGERHAEHDGGDKNAPASKPPAATNAEEKKSEEGIEKKKKKSWHHHGRGRHGKDASDVNQNDDDGDDKAKKPIPKQQQQKTTKKGKQKAAASDNDEPKQQKSSEGRSRTRKTKKKNEHAPFPSHWSLDDCMALYIAKDPSIVRGKIRVLPAKNAKAFVSCDRGHFGKDILIDTTLEQNRALDGDTVFVELYPEEEATGQELSDLTKKVETIPLGDDDDQKMETSDQEKEDDYPTWQDDPVQRDLWDPQVKVRRTPDGHGHVLPGEEQRKGRVIYVIPPKESAGTQPSELKPSDKSYKERAPRRTIVGTMNKMTRGRGDLFLLTPNNKSLPQFLCPSRFKADEEEGNSGALYKAEYEYGSWAESHRWPSCVNVVRMGSSCNVEDETLALLVEHDVNHGDFPAQVLRNVDEAVESGITVQASAESEQDLGWRPTPQMYYGRRDYRNQRIFTIDPTTAKDLDDALHITELPDGRIEIGVHIADVSHFVQPGSAVDLEAQRRATTVYLVDRVIPMLPRPLCEVACSLNENVERLAFSCVWRMNRDGTMGSRSKGDADVWYGRSVIKSCARLDYATAQNIIEKKVATGEPTKDMDEDLWPAARRPTGGHTVDQVAADVRLMHVVAMARRRLRFRNGAIALNGIKLAFQLDSDGETPMLCAPYPIRDSNRLVEEYMLLANYLVAQRLISHAGGLALLRHHPPPLSLGIENVVKVAKEGMGFDIDATSSQTLQQSLSRLGRECNDDLVMQCVTEMLTAPMRPAEYVAAGGIAEEEWRHFALNIPYYTHFTSPIRRYADVIVHRLLQATIDGDDAVDDFPMEQQEVQQVATHCNEKRMGAKKAQERSDRVFLSLYVRKHPLSSELGVCLSVGEKTFTVFVPSLGASLMLFLDEHKDLLTFESFTVQDERRIRLTRKASGSNTDDVWSEIEVKVFTKLRVSCHCKEKPPIDVRVRLEGPWRA